MEDVTLEFKDGRIISHSARVGDDDLTRIIEKDDGEGEGSRFVGELGIGTNPHLRHHYVNSLLVEKVSGSFHLAIGNAYSYKTYNGQPVVVDNGNKSASATHWDVTAMLRGNGGKLIVDDEIIQADGQWLDPELAVLNDGWGAIDVARQPAWWRERYPNGY
jgi:aminopeptidase